MYRLYGYREDEMYGRKFDKLGEYQTEYEVIKKIDQEIRDAEIILYFITKNQEYYMAINCYEDFIDYIDYYRRSKIEDEFSQRNKI